MQILVNIAACSSHHYAQRVNGFQSNLGLDSNVNVVGRKSSLLPFIQLQAPTPNVPLKSPFPFAIFAQNIGGNEAIQETKVEGDESSTPITTSKSRERKDAGSSVFEILEVDMRNNSFCGNTFAATDCWGSSPLLMRGAFHSQAELLGIGTTGDVDVEGIKDIDSGEISSLWPSWDEVMELAFDDDAESRLITHVPDDPLSWKLKIGPFATNDLDGFVSSDDSSDDSGSSKNGKDKDEKWTMVFNDVDRFYPPLFDFITDSFSFVPNWRKDDGQSE